MRDDFMVLNIFLPAARRSYEFRVPVSMTVGESLVLIADLMASVQPEFYQNNQEADLIIQQAGPLQGLMLNPCETYAALVDRGLLSSGAQLVLV